MNKESSFSPIFIILVTKLVGSIKRRCPREPAPPVSVAGELRIRTKVELRGFYRGTDTAVKYGVLLAW